MKPDETLYESIDLYLSGKLEGEALSAFTDKLESDKEFPILVLNQKAANDIILGNRLAMVKQMMDADFKSTDSGSGARKWWLGGLLGSSILIGSILYISNEKTEITSSYATATVQQKSIDTNSSPIPGKQTVEQAPLVLPKHLLNADATSIQTSSPELNVQTYSQNNTSTELKFLSLNNVNTTIIDTIQAKNSVTYKQSTTQKTDMCLGITIDGILSVDAACTNKNDGEIHIREQSVKGGSSPYTYLLIDTANDTIRQKNNSFVSLSKGQYKLLFEDANACLSAYKKPLYVNEKSCIPRAQSFSPHAGERFNYPVSGDSDAEITIYNRGGQLVYKKHLEKGAFEFWDGSNQHGQLLPTGMYIYIIEYVSGTKETGEVVIF